MHPATCKEEMAIVLTLHQCGGKKNPNQLVVGLRTQYMLIKIAEASLLCTKNNVCLGNLKGQINHDRTFYL